MKNILVLITAIASLATMKTQAAQAKISLAQAGTLISVMTFIGSELLQKEIRESYTSEARQNGFYCQQPYHSNWSNSTLLYVF